MVKNYIVNTTTKLSIPIEEIEKILGKHIKLDLVSEFNSMASDIKILKEEIRSNYKLIVDLNKRIIELEKQLLKKKWKVVDKKGNIKE